MPHSVLKDLPKREQQKLLASEARRRRSGDWGPWLRLENPWRGKSGWVGEVHHVQKNRVFSVLVRDVGVAHHYAISSLSQRRPTWYEMQRIKDELAGEEVTAVEVYPPKAEIIDGADMFHFWVLPSHLPFSLKDDRHLAYAEIDI